MLNFKQPLYKQNKALMNTALFKVYMVLYAILQPLKQP